MQSKLMFPGGAHANRGIAAVRVRHRCAPPRGGAEFYPGEADETMLTEASSIGEAASSQAPRSSDTAEFSVVASRMEHTVSSVDEVTEGMRNCSEDDFRSSPPAEAPAFDPLPLGSTLVSGPIVAVRHKFMDSAASAHEIPPAEVSTSTESLEATEVSQTSSMRPDAVQPVSTPRSIQVNVKSAPELAAPVATSATQPAAVNSAPATPVRVTAVSDTFTTGGKPSPGNRDSFITGQPSPSATQSPRPYLASSTTDQRGYPAFKFDEAAATQYSSAAQSMPHRPNYEARYSSRSSNCDSAPPPLADALSSSKSVGMPSGPSDGYGYRRVPQEAVPGYGYSRASGPQQQAPQRPYQYRLPPDYAPHGGPLPLSPPSGRGLPPQQYGPQNDPWDIFESGSAIGHSQGLLHIDGGVYGGGGGYGGYSNQPPGYGGPSSSYGYGGSGPGGGGYAAPAPPPPPPSYQYGGHGNGGGGYGQQQQYYAPPPPGQYGGGASQQGGYRGAPPPQADPGQFYGGNYSAPASPRRAAPQPEPNYTYKARAPAGNMPEENLSSYTYGNAYNGGTGFGSGGNYGGQTAYGSPVPGNYPGGGQQEEASYPGIELLSPGYPEFERHARQTGGSSGGGIRNSAGELRYPGIEGGSPNVQQQRTVAPAGVTEYSDWMTPPAYGSSYSGYTAPSAYELPPPDAYAQYQQPPQGGYYGAPPPAPPPEAYGYRGYPGAGAAYPGVMQGYPQRPMGFTSPEEGGPVAVRQPRILVSKEMPQGEQLLQIRATGGAAPHVPVETVLPFAALPEASNVAMLAAANAPGPAPTLHLGVLAAALCCVIAASAGVTVPVPGGRKQE